MTIIERKRLNNSKKLGIHFNNLNLLLQALTHRSYSNENNSPLNNERLEFLGDAVLSLTIANYLYQKYPDHPEGRLTRIRSTIVSEDMLSFLGKELEINKYIFIGKGEELSNGREKKALIADAFEAIIGAYYIDQKMKKAESFIIKLFKYQIEQVVNEKTGVDYKSLLQEYSQKHFKTCPSYVVVKETGLEHAKEFTVLVKINNKPYCKGIGKTKKEAEKMAAQKHIKNFNKSREAHANKC